MTKLPTTIIPPSCRAAGVLTAGELRAEETQMMECDEANKSATTDERQTTSLSSSPTKEAVSTSEDEETIRPYQKHRTKDPKRSGTPVADLSDDLPGHLYEDLCGYWRSHSYYQSRIRIFEGFATDGPFPSITSFQFKEDPQTSPTRKFADQLDSATRSFKETICKIHASNYEHLATNELAKINTLVKEANTMYDNTLVQDTVKRAKIHAFNKAREIRRLKNKKKNRSNENHNNENNRDKRRRSPSRGRSRERKRR